jgi:hypothetical protein
VLADLEGRLDPDLQELVRREQPAGSSPVGTKRRHERDDRHEAGINQDPSNVRDPTDALRSVGGAVSEVGIDSVT